MELSISNADAEEIGLDSAVKEQIVRFVHQHLGLASVAVIAVDEGGVHVSVRDGQDGNAMVLDHALTKRIDN